MTDRLYTSYIPNALSVIQGEGVHHHYAKKGRGRPKKVHHRRAGDLDYQGIIGGAVHHPVPHRRAGDLDDQGVVGAVGKHTAANDTWVLTEKMAQDLAAGADLAGHEMVITGYDDTAQAIDDTGVSHYGLFTLRNSWGPGIGDEGDFYMSYDYVKALIIEAQRIRDVSNLTN